MKNSIFNDIIGNDNAKNELKTILTSGVIPHSWLFSGPKGIGKQQMAMALVKSLFSNLINVENRIALKTLPDFMYISPEDAKEINVVKIREIGKFLSLTSAESKYRIVLIDDAELMNKFAANALLKILEEPPSHAIVILIAHNISKILPTIKSRCYQLKLYPLSDDEFAKYISNNHDIIHMSGGCPGLSDMLIKNKADNMYTSLIKGLTQNNQSWLFDFIENFSLLKDNDKWNSFIIVLNYLIQNITKLNLSKSNDENSISLKKIFQKHTIERWIENYYQINQIIYKINTLNLDKKQSLIVITSIISGDLL